MAVFCGVSSTQSEVASLGFWQWPMGHRLTWTVVKTIPDFSRDDLVDVARQAWKHWDDISGISIEYTQSAANANILIGCRKIDGGLGVLAEAELPPPGIRPDAQLRLWLDETDRFVLAENPPSNSIDLLRVMIHEQGHNLGLGHQTDPTIDAIMAPAISKIRRLMQWDMNQAQLRYGIEKPPVPVPTPGEPGDDDVADLLDQIAKCLRNLKPSSRSLVRELLRDV